jgi:hypothetical protein
MNQRISKLSAGVIAFLTAASVMLPAIAQQAKTQAASTKLQRGVSLPTQQPPPYSYGAQPEWAAPPRPGDSGYVVRVGPRCPVCPNEGGYVVSGRGRGTYAFPER